MPRNTLLRMLAGLRQQWPARWACGSVAPQLTTVCCTNGRSLELATHPAPAIYLAGCTCTFERAPGCGQPLRQQVLYGCAEDAGLRIGRGEIGAGCGAVPPVHESRAARASLQDAEHVEQCGSHT